MEHDVLRLDQAKQVLFFLNFDLHETADGQIDDRRREVAKVHLFIDDRPDFSRAEILRRLITHDDRAGARRIAADLLPASPQAGDGDQRGQQDQVRGDELAGAGNRTGELDQPGREADGKRQPLVRVEDAGSLDLQRVPAQPGPEDLGRRRSVDTGAAGFLDRVVVNGGRQTDRRRRVFDPCRPVGPGHVPVELVVALELA